MSQRSAAIVAGAVGLLFGTSAGDVELRAQVGPAAVEAAPRGESVYARLLRSTGWVVAEDGSGTAWVVDKERKLLVTNYHVVTSSETKAMHERVQIVFPEYEDGRAIAERDHYTKRAAQLAGRGRIVEARVIDASETLDLALLAVDKLPSEAVAVPLARRSAEPSVRVHSIGNPGRSSSLWLYTQGYVKQVARKEWRSHMGGGNFLHHAARVMETQAPTNPGDSGGPVVDDAGELVGVTQGGAGDADLLNWAIDVSEVRAFVAASAWMVDAKTAEQLFARGQRYFDREWHDVVPATRRRYDLALADFNAALAQQPGNPTFLLERARLYRSIGLHKTVMSSFVFDLPGSATFGKPKPAPAEYALALADCDAALRKRPNDPIAYARRGEVRFALAPFDKATAARSPFTLEPVPAKPVESVLDRFGKVDHEALGKADCAKAIELDENCFDAYAALATYYSYKDPAKSVEQFAQAIRICPNVAGLHSSRGSQAELAGQVDVALADYGRAIERNPKSEYFLRQRASLLEKQRRFEEAVRDRLAAVKLVPESSYDWRWLGDAFAAWGKHAEAIAAFTQGLTMMEQLGQKHGDPVALLEGRGDAHAKLGDRDAAFVDYATTLKIATIGAADAERIRNKAVALQKP